MQRRAPLLAGSGPWDSCNTLPHCLGAVSSAVPAMHCRTALRHSASPPGGQWASELVQSTAPLHGSCGRRNSCNTPLHFLGAVGSGTSATHCPTTWAQWAAKVLQRTAALPRGGGQWDSCNTLPNRLGAMGSTTPAMHCRSAWGLWAVQLLRHSASLHGGQWAVELLQCTAPLPRGSGRWDACNALPHCLEAVGSGTSAMHCLIALRQWAVELLQRTASLPGGSG